jgi:hypothetical protein
LLLLLLVVVVVLLLIVLRVGRCYYCLGLAAQRPRC